ncbi:coiled-coil domain-containing protein [Oopsacas minuta]|uniref:Coiled-coil domain-containing protein n=1 Tax=Oopsacas minuta TaxID=111878 RepID=A0AAV7JX42_9METZ|nr:coiled-coil domain-containing protein [Oopsacas minuta]
MDTSYDPSFASLINSTSRPEERIKDLERELLVTREKLNEEIGRLTREQCSIRSELERSEAARQKVELELTKSKRREDEMTEQNNELETVSRETRINLESKVTQLSKQCREWKITLDAVHRARVQEKQEQEVLLKQKEEKNTHRTFELDKLQHEQRARETDILQLQHNYECLEKELHSTKDTNRKLSQQNEFFSIAVDTGKEEAIALRDELKAFQHSLENERTTAMEIKCGNEVLTVKVHDLERLLESEREISRDCRTNMEHLQESRRGLEKKRDEDIKMCQELNEKLIRTESEFRGLQDQLFTKERLILELSEQVKLHQDNFSKLRDELENTVIQQSELHDGYSREMSQIETVLQSFQRGTMLTNKSSELSQQIKSILTKFHTDSVESKTEFNQLKDSFDTLNGEYKSYRDLIQANNGTMRQAEEKLSIQDEVITKLKREVETGEKLSQSLKQDLEKITRKRNHAKEELEKAQKNKQSDYESHSRYLHYLYQLLVHGHSSARVPTYSEISPPGEETAPLSWKQLATMVAEQTQAKLNIISEYEGKLAQFDQNSIEHAAKFSQVKGLYQQGLGKCAELEKHLELIGREKLNLEQQLVHTKEQSAVSIREREGMEEENKNRLNELEQRTISQEQELDRAFEALAKREQELTMFLGALALLTSTLIPSLRACSELAIQKKFLHSEFSRLHILKQQVSELVSSLQEEAIISGIIPSPHNALDNPNPKANLSKSTPKRVRKGCIAQSVFSVQDEFLNSPAMKLRRGIIVVMATKRLFYIYKEKRNTIKLCVKAGPSELGAITTSMSISSGATAVTNKKSDPFYDWMTSPDLHELVVRSMLEAYAYIRSNQEKEHATRLGPDRAFDISIAPAYQASRGPHPAENSLKSLLTNLQTFFPFHLSVHSPNERWDHQGWAPVGTRVSNGPSAPDASLLSLLGDGLNAQIRKNKKFIPVDDIGMMLEAGLLGLISRLKESELAKDRLHQKLLRSEEQGNELKIACQQALRMENQVDQLSLQLQTHVPKESYESMSSELQEAIDREHQTQTVLTTQSEKIEQLKGRLQKNTLELQRRENTLQESLQELTNVKQDSARANQQSRLSDRQLTQLQDTCQHTQLQLRDAQLALRTTAREREILVKYLRRANHIFIEAKSKLHLSAHTNAPLELERMMSPSTELLNSMEEHNNFPQLDSCMVTVKTFLEFYQYSLGRISFLHSQLIQTQSHATALKHEVDAATRRQLTEAAISIDNPSRHSRQYSPLPEIAITRTSPMKSSPKLDHGGHSRLYLDTLNNELRPDSQFTDTLSFAPLQGTPINVSYRSDTHLSSDTYFRPIPLSPTPSEQGQQLGQRIAQSLEGYNLST